MGSKKILALAVSALAVSASAAMAQGPAGFRPPMGTKPTTLTISASSEVSAAPDVARINAGVMTEAPDAQTALAQNTERMTRVIAALKKAGISERDIQTSNLSVDAQYRYEENRSPILNGFRASNQVRVVLRDLRSSGKVIDALVREGANQLDGPSFAVSNPDPLIDKARVEAVKKARARADLYAEATGLKVVGIRSISEGQSRSPVMPRVMMASAEKAMDTPVQAGEVEMSVTVTIEFDLAK